MKNQPIRFTFFLGISVLTVSVPNLGLSQGIGLAQQMFRQAQREAVVRPDHSDAQAPKSEKEKLQEVYSAMRSAIESIAPDIESRANLIERYEEFVKTIEKDPSKGDHRYDELASVLEKVLKGGALRTKDGKDIETKPLKVADVKALGDSIELLDGFAQKKSKDHSHWMRIELRSTALLATIKKAENAAVEPTKADEGKTLGQTLMSQLDEIMGVNASVSAAEQALNSCPSTTEISGVLDQLRHEKEVLEAKTKALVHAMKIAGTILGSEGGGSRDKKMISFKLARSSHKSLFPMTYDASSSIETATLELEASDEALRVVANALEENENVNSKDELEELFYGDYTEKKEKHRALTADIAALENCLIRLASVSDDEAKTVKDRSLAELKDSADRDAKTFGDGAEAFKRFGSKSAK